MTYGSPSSLDDVPRVPRGSPRRPRARRRARRRVHAPLPRHRRLAAGGDHRRARQRRWRRRSAAARGRGGDALLRAVDRDGLRSLADGRGRRGRGDHPLPAVLADDHGRLRPGRGARPRLRRDRAPGAPERRRSIAGAWHLQPAFIDALAGRVREALARIDPDGSSDRVPVLLPRTACRGASPTRSPAISTSSLDTAQRGRRARGASAGPLDVLLAERRARAGRVDEAGLRRPDAGAPARRPPLGARRAGPVPRRPPRDPLRHRRRRARAGRGAGPRVRADRVAQHDDRFIEALAAVVEATLA